MDWQQFFDILNRNKKRPRKVCTLKIKPLKAYIRLISFDISQQVAVNHS